MILTAKHTLRIGIDLGGTKIEALAIDSLGRELARHRVPTPRFDYASTISTIVDAVARIERELGAHGSVGIAIPGTISSRTGRVKNANSTWLNGMLFAQDLRAALGREVRIANDANCLAVSEATDGAGAGQHVVFAVILGTGCGAGISMDGRVHPGLNGVGGEWGHNPLPWQQPGEYPGPACYCGRHGCIETWISGTGLEGDYERTAGAKLSGAEIVAEALQRKESEQQFGQDSSQEPEALACLARFEDRLARSLAHVVNILDPDVIVVGGGLSKIARLYSNVPPLLNQYVFGKECDTPVLPAKHGDASGVRGAAWLWPLS